MADFSFNTGDSSHDSIHVKNIQLASPIIARDVWGNLKEQIGSVSVHLLLRKGFSTASDADKLDDSTIHYGNLTKQIRANCQQDSKNVIQAVESAICTLATKADGRFIVARSVVQLMLPKATMLGTELILTSDTCYDEKGKRQEPVTNSFGVKNVTIPTLIGVNAYERTMKQPLVVSFTVQQGQQELLHDIEPALVEVSYNMAHRSPWQRLTR